MVANRERPSSSRSLRGHPFICQVNGLLLGPRLVSDPVRNAMALVRPAIPRSAHDLAPRPLHAVAWRAEAHQAVRRGLRDLRALRALRALGGILLGGILLGILHGRWCFDCCRCGRWCFDCCRWTLHAELHSLVTLALLFIALQQRVQHAKMAFAALQKLEPPLDSSIDLQLSLGLEADLKLMRHSASRQAARLPCGPRRL